MTDALDVLALHRELVAIRSPSHEEEEIAGFVHDLLAAESADVWRVGRNVLARTGHGRRLLFNSHLDTVVATPSWTRDPFMPVVDGDRVYGLGANDAKAAVAGMIAAFVGHARAGAPGELVLMLVADEETGGEGTEKAWPELQGRGFVPEGIVVGEPTGLDVAVAQKGLLVLELIEEGDACHSANARAMGARNAIHLLARDLVALQDLQLGGGDPWLGGATLEPTVVRGGERRNALPDRVSCYLDIRTVPGTTPAAITARVRDCVGGQVRVHSERLLPVSCPETASIVRAATTARPAAAIYGSRTMSDLVFFAGHPAIKCGPGRSERSHTPDEFVLLTEVLEGARFYGALIEAFTAPAGAAS